MRTIPVSQLVQVNPGVLAAAGSVSNLIGLILTNNTAIPIGGPTNFATADSVGQFFGYSSAEYTMALTYFQGPTNAGQAPSSLLFAQYPSAAVAAYLRGGKLGTTLAALQLLTGTLTVTIDGTPNTSASINLSAATSFSDAAAKIQAAFTTPNFGVTYDSQRDAFLFTSSTTGKATAAAFATDNSLAESLKLTSATGAVLSQGADAATPSAFMAGLLALDNTWSLFTTVFEPVLADKTSFSDWTGLQNNTLAYVGFDSDVNALTSGSTSTWAAAVIKNGDSGTVPIYGTNQHAAFVLGFAASLDFSQRNGRATLAFKSQSGLTPTVSDATNAQSLITNGYNFYGIYGAGGQQFNMMQNGSITGQYKWLDSFLDQLWIRRNLQLSLLNLLMSVGSVPYNSDGYSLISAACADPITSALNYGAIRAGVQLSASQAQQVNQAVGSVVAPSIQASGYYLQVSPATASARAARQSPPITLYYTDGQSIQNISMNAIEIQ